MPGVVQPEPVIASGAPEVNVMIPGDLPAADKCPDHGVATAHAVALTERQGIKECGMEVVTPVDSPERLVEAAIEWVPVAAHSTEIGSRANRVIDFLAEGVSDLRGEALGEPSLQV